MTRPGGAAFFRRSAAGGSLAAAGAVAFGYAVTAGLAAGRGEVVGGSVDVLFRIAGRLARPAGRRGGGVVGGGVDLALLCVANAHNFVLRLRETVSRAAEVGNRASGRRHGWASQPWH